MTSDADWTRIVDGWGTRAGLSGHARRAAAWDGRPGPGMPVPGCGCPRCAAYAVGGTPKDGFHAEALVRHLAALPPDLRREALDVARRERSRRGLDPDPCVVRDGVLLELARRRPGALRVPSTAAQETSSEEPDRDPLPVERARRVPIEDVVRRLGLPDPKKRGRELVTTCPLHADENPSLTLSPEPGLWYCFPCGRGGDGIRLVEEALGLDFAEAVRWVADGGPAPASGTAAQGLLGSRGRNA